MKIKNQIENWNSENFLEKYLKSCGVKNPTKYLATEKIKYQNPLEYPNIDKAVDLFHKHLINGDKFGVVVDCDVDGFLSATAIVELLKTFKANYVLFFHKGKEHGLSEDIIEEVRGANLDLLIIPDAACNTNIGVDTLVLDHHRIENGNLGDNIVIVNPYLDREKRLNTALSGTGVTAKFIEAFCKNSQIKLPYLTDLVAVSIIADVCDMTSEENRKYVSEGLCDIRNEMLKSMFILLSGTEHSAKVVGWQIAPKINALIRTVDERMATVFSAFLGEYEPRKAINILKDAYDKQTAQVNEALKNIQINAEHNIVVGYIPKIYKAYTGLIANKLLNKYGDKPIVVLRNETTDTYIGSLRSDIPLTDILNESGLCTAQGHDNAAGLTIDKENITAFFEFADKNITLENGDDDETTEVTATIPEINSFDNSLCKTLTKHKDLWANNIKEPTFYCEFDISKDDIAIYQKATTTIKFNTPTVSFVKFRASKGLVSGIENADYFHAKVISTLSGSEYEGFTQYQGYVSVIELTPITKPKADLDFSSFFSDN